MEKPHDSVAKERNMDLLKTMNPSSFSKQTLSRILDETFEARRELVTKAASIKEILDSCPYMKNPEHVSLVFYVSMDGDEFTIPIVICTFTGYEQPPPP